MAFVSEDLPSVITLNPGFKPAFEGLRAEYFVSDSREYRNHYRREIFDYLHRGGNGVDACSYFSNVTYHILDAFLDKVKIDAFSLSIREFLVKHQLAAAFAGGTASGTMAPQSDLDIFLISSDASRFQDADSELRRGLAIIQSKFWDILAPIGFGDIGYHLYAHQYVAEDLPKSDMLQTTTALLSCRHLGGDADVFKGFHQEIIQNVKVNREKIIENIVAELHVRHKTYGFNSNLKNVNLKESPGCLRDIDTIRWLQAVKRISEGSIAADSLLSPEEEKSLQDASSIYLQLKYLAHYSSKETTKTVNILSQDRIIPVFQPFADIIPPHQDGGRDAYRLLYEQIENVSRILEAVVDRVKVKPEEQVPQVYNTLQEAVLSGLPHADILNNSLKAIRCLTHNYEIPEEGRALWILPFEARRSVKFIREKLEGAPPEIFKLENNQNEFMRIIEDCTAVKGGMRLLHHAGLLTRFLPCFSEIRRFNEIYAYQDCNLEEHSLQCAESLRAFFKGEIKGTEEFYANFSYLADRHELIIAALLHDVGRKKESPGLPHEEIGARLAMDELGNHMVSNLILHHSLLPKLAYGLGSCCRGELLKAAEVIGSQEFLDMLFVLTWVDKYTSNREMFTPTKQRWLLELYRKLDDIIVQKEAGVPPISLITISTMSARRDTGVFTLELLEDHLMKLPEDYRYECTPQTIAEHLTFAEKLKKIEGVEGSKFFGLSWLANSPEIKDRSMDLVFVAKDKPGLFRDIALALYQKNLEIKDAHIYTRSDGIACNIFNVAPRHLNSLALQDEESRQGLIKSLTMLLRGENTEKLYISTYQGQVNSPLIAALKVSFNSDSELCIECEDRAGLAYLIGESLTEQGLSITSAKLNTGNRGIRNLFHVVKLDRTTLSAEEKACIERRLTEVLLERPMLQ